MKIITTNKHCRICKNKKMVKVFEFGPAPLANAFLKRKQLNCAESFYPLNVFFCKYCNLLQLKDIVDPRILFRDYVYVSSTSEVFGEHFKDFSQKSIIRFHLSHKSLVIDIGSNDGILLEPFKKKNVNVLGIEPAKNIARMARKKGINTVAEFISFKLAESIVEKYGLADLVTATNVFAHINDLDTVVMSVKKLISKNGVFVIEAPYLIDFLKNNLFDTVYHEHLSYLSITPLKLLFKHYSMKIFDVERVNTHGGSIRVYIANQSSNHIITKAVKNMVALEKKLQLDKVETYRNFAKKIMMNKRLLNSLLTRLKQKGKTIVGYGAPAKGNTLLNYFNIGKNILDYIVDDSIFKQGLFTPGTHIPVVSPNTLKVTIPDFILILAWNFAPSIMKNYEWIKKRGGKFIVPVPVPKII